MVALTKEAQRQFCGLQNKRSLKTILWSLKQKKLKGNSMVADVALTATLLSMENGGSKEPTNKASGQPMESNIEEGDPRLWQKGLQNSASAQGCN